MNVFYVILSNRRKMQFNNNKFEAIHAPLMNYTYVFLAVMD